MTPLISGKMNKLCPVDAPCQSNADSGRRSNRQFFTFKVGAPPLKCQLMSRHASRLSLGTFLHLSFFVSFLGFEDPT